jgi:hypothetical protein
VGWVAAKHGAAVNYKEQFSDGTMVAAFDVRESLMNLGPANIQPMMSLMRTTLLSTFPSVELELLDHQRTFLESEQGSRTQRVWVRLKEVETPPAYTGGRALRRFVGS